MPIDDDWGVVQTSSTAALLYDYRAGGRYAVVEIAQGARPRELGAEPRSHSLTGGKAFVLYRDRTFTGFDARSGHVRWQRSLEHAWEYVTSSDDCLYVVEAGHIVAIDLDTGAVRWRILAPLGVAAWPSGDPFEAAFATGSRLYLLSKGRLMGVDAAGGAIAFTTAAPRPAGCPAKPYDIPQFFADGRHAISFYCDEWWALDSATGAVNARRPAPPRLSGRLHAALRGDLFYAAGEEGELIAIDITTGNERFRLAMRAGWLQAAEDALFVCTRGGVLHALDPSFGTSVWSYGVGVCAEYPKLPAFYVVHGAAGGAGVVARVEGVGHVGFARADTPPATKPFELRGTARINGRLAPAVGVWVADARVVSNAAGEWRAVVRRPGVVQVALDAKDVERRTRRPCPYLEAVFVMPDRAAAAIEVKGKAGGCDDLSSPD